MKFLLMMNAPYGQAGDHEIFSWPPEAIQAHVDYWGELNRELKEAGEFVGVHALTPPKQARIVRAGSDGLPAITDGPFPESKEFLAGFWTVDVESAERALQIAAKASAAPGPDGEPLHMAIEVRQVMSAPASDQA
ncbi:MAG TPA: YciI family protein [Longimicrobium sp.]|nr:YciI family protein [Longimicrobium sp.]